MDNKEEGNYLDRIGRLLQAARRRSTRFGGRFVRADGSTAKTAADPLTVALGGDFPPGVVDYIPPEKHETADPLTIAIDSTIRERAQAFAARKGGA